jgi:hypothetical protein
VSKLCGHRFVEAAGQQPASITQYNQNTSDSHLSTTLSHLELLLSFRKKLLLTIPDGEFYSEVRTHNFDRAKQTLIAQIYTSYSTVPMCTGCSCVTNGNRPLYNDVRVVDAQIKSAMSCAMAIVAQLRLLTSHRSQLTLHAHYLPDLSDLVNALSEVWQAVSVSFNEEMPLSNSISTFDAQMAVSDARRFRALQKRNEYVTINRLPVEVLLEIFRFSTQCRPPRTDIISAVCHHW